MAKNKAREAVRQRNNRLKKKREFDKLKTFYRGRAITLIRGGAYSYNHVHIILLTKKFFPLSKEISNVEHEYVNIAPPPLNVAPPPLVIQVENKCW